MTSTYQFSQSGFITVPSAGSKGDSPRFLSSLPFPCRVLQVASILLFLALVGVYVIQINVVSGASIRFEKLKKESAGLEGEYVSLASSVRSRISLDNLELLSQTFAMERGEARFLEETIPLFVSK